MGVRVSDHSERSYAVRVACLYIDPRGPYPKLAADYNSEDAPVLARAFGFDGSDDYPPDLDCWDAERDARKYEGPDPIVAHPPCGPWGRLRHLYRGDEHDCAPRAVGQVRRWGGVLEHPAGSLLWNHGLDPADEYIGLPEPDEGVDRFDGHTVEVNQVEWGHCARKATWLYIVGVAPSRVQELIDARPFPGREPTHWISGGRGRGRKGKKAKTTPVPPGIKVCSAQQRRRTPPAFAEFLIAIAREARRP